MMKVVSPLTGTDDVSLLQTLPTSKLIEGWNKQYGINIASELNQYPEIYLYQCNQTKLNFFFPVDIAGSDKLYEKLEKFDWYYMERKWEHDMAINDIGKGQKILEVGCGRGAFVKRLQQEEGLDACGIELNTSAVEYAKQQGIPVQLISLYDLAEQKPNSFDIVCNFQVLEHISDPKPFLEAMIKLLKNQGKLIIAVPNHDSFLKDTENNLLEMPPHHVTQWTPETFKKISSFLPVECQKILYEPLAIYHISWYILTYKYKYPKYSFQGFSSRIFYKIWEPLLHNFPLMRNFVKGHTMYAVFEKVKSV